MNTDAQRARNARKRAKLRAKRRGQQGYWRVKLTADEDYYYREGTWRRFPGANMVELARMRVLPAGEWHPHARWSTEWIIASTHDVSSSVIDAIACFVNTLGRPINGRDWCASEVILEFQRNGFTRRKIWRGIDRHVTVGEIVAVVCSFASQSFNEV